MKKTIYTLVVDDYAPAIRDLTFPSIKHYAKKIGADFHVIGERKFPSWPVTYEKLQIFELGKAHRNDWNLFVDADTLISPEMFDITEHLHKDTIAHNGKDMAGVRWTIDNYFRRDGRFYGSCNWLAVASDWCLDLWHPLHDLTLDEALSRIHITIGENNSGYCRTEHLIDDYTLSRNVARFGLKATTVSDICGNLGWKTPEGKGFSPFLFHLYTISNEEKIKRMLAVMTTPNAQPFFADGKGNFQLQPVAPGHAPAGIGWGLMSMEDAAAYRSKWGVK